MSDQTDKAALTYDGSISDLVKSLINTIVKDSTEYYGDTPLEKIRNKVQHDTGENTLHGITALSAYVTAKASERQAIAMESLAKTASKLQVAESLDVGGQSIVDQREPKRDYLATTYSLPTSTLSLLWAIRGMLMDASVKSLSRPDRFDPYRRLTTEEIAWSLRTTADNLLAMLPHHGTAGIHFDLLEEFDILHYGGTDEQPDDWAYGG